MAPLSFALAKEGFDSIVQATQDYRIAINDYTGSQFRGV
jgi:hypothetical protein